MMLDEALRILAPGAKWTLSGNTLDGLDWQDDTIPQPSARAINAKMREELPPPPRSMTRKMWCAQLASIGKLAAWRALMNDASVSDEDWSYLLTGSVSGNYVESDPQLLRLAAKAGIDVAAVFDAA